MPSALFSFGNNDKKRQEKKRELLQYIKPLQRGLKASEEDVATIERLCRELERLNPNKASLASPLINGCWELQVHCCVHILGFVSIPHCTVHHERHHPGAQQAPVFAPTRTNIPIHRRQRPHCS